MIGVSLKLNVAEALAAGRSGAARGLTAAAFRLQALSVPLTPRDIGDLRTATEVEPATEGSLQSRVYNNQEYAARQHEELTWRHEVGQAKYLEQPAKANANEFGDIIAAQMRRALRS